MRRPPCSCPAVVTAALAAASLALAPPALAQLAASPAPHAVSDLPDDPAAWRTTYLTRFNARLTRSLDHDQDLELRLGRLWNTLLAKLDAPRQLVADPLQQYPVLGFVDDQFYVMRSVDRKGRETWVVGPQSVEPEVPTLSSTLERYLEEVVYAQLAALAREEQERAARFADYRPALDELAALDPYQGGYAIKLPDMGLFKNRTVQFVGLRGRLSDRETEAYEATKWESSREGAAVVVARPSPWGLAVETAELVRDGRSVCRYRTVRQVAGVEDVRLVAAGSTAVIRRPRLGPVLEVRGCVDGCDGAEAWTQIFPHPEDAEPPPARRASAGRPELVDRAAERPGRFWDR